jgi:carbon storage regulator
MLILTRRAGESVRIGDEIIVEVLEVKKDKVRLGVKAPKNTKIARVENHHHQKIDNERFSTNND